MKPTPPIAARRGLTPVFTYSQARAAGISSDGLHSYRMQGWIEQIGRGLYRWTDATEADQNFIEIAYRVPQGTLCLLSALAHHGLTDAIPPRIDIAIPRGQRVPKLNSPVNIHVFAIDTFHLGRKTLHIDAQSKIGLYSPERSLVDIIRLRHREGTEIAWESLRQWLRRRDSKPATLIELASHFHGAERAIRHALEIVL